MQMTTFYDMKGRPYRSGIRYYKDSKGDILRVPSFDDTREKIFRYVIRCLEAGLNLSYPLDETDEEVISYLEEIWEEGENKTKRIMEMLDRRAKELKEEGSVRTHLYTETRKILGRWTVPVFNRQQLLNIPSTIVDEIDDILRE
jgi:hypothetical protein